MLYALQVFCHSYNFPKGTLTALLLAFRVFSVLFFLYHLKQTDDLIQGWGLSRNDSKITLLSGQLLHFNELIRN